MHIALGAAFCAICVAIVFFAPQPPTHAKSAPAAWGGNHVGEELPPLDDGSQCLFCHRTTVGNTWQTDRHNKTVRIIEQAPEDKAALKNAGVDAAIVEEIMYVIGDTRSHAYIKPSAAYGTADLLDARINPITNEVTAKGSAAWREGSFNESCAGCHATAYDNTTQYYQALALDCYTCHDQPPLSHTENPVEALFNKQTPADAKVLTSICASCHIRGATSKSTGRAHANNFVPGDNLFQDLEVDWSDAALEKLNPADKHIMLNIRDVVVEGKEEVTCLTCHSIHKQNTLRHRKLADAPSCFVCHSGADTKSGVKAYEVHSEVCGY